MPDTLLYTRPDVTLRKPALPGFIVRRCFAANVRTGRQILIEACRSELVWAEANYVKHYGIAADSEWRPGVPRSSEASRLPHEVAAARVLRAWDNLHPIEGRLHQNIEWLREQRDRGQAERAHGTEEFVRELVERRRAAAWAFWRAVEVYRTLRRAVTAEMPVAP